MGWQADLHEAARLDRERRMMRHPWVVTCVASPFGDVPTFSRVWATTVTAEVAGQDLDIIATCYERRIAVTFARCPDGAHTLIEFVPPIESVAVMPERMTSFVNALRASGYHARCSDGKGKTYEF